MDSNIVFSDVVHGDWTVHDNEVVISSEEVLPAVTKTEVISDAEKVSGEEQSHENDEVIDIESHSDLEDLDKEPTNNIHESMHPSSAPMPHDPNVYMSPQYFESVVRQEPIPQQFLYYPGFAHGYSVSSTYHQPFVSMVRQKKTSALATVLGYSLRPPVPVSEIWLFLESLWTQHIAQSHIDYVPRYPFGYENQYSQQVDVNYNELINEEQDVKISCTISKNPHENKSTRFENVEEKAASPSSSFPFTDCCRENVSCIPSRPIPSFGLSTEETSNDFSTGASHGKSKEARQNHHIARVADYVDGGLLDGGISRHQTDEALGTDNGDTGAIEVESEDENDEIVVVDDEGDIGAAPTTAVSDKDDAEEAATSSGDTKHQKSPLEKLLLQPVKKRLYSAAITVGHPHQTGAHLNINNITSCTNCSLIPFSQTLVLCIHMRQTKTSIDTTIDLSRSYDQCDGNKAQAELFLYSQPLNSFTLHFLLFRSSIGPFPSFASSVHASFPSERLLPIIMRVVKLTPGRQLMLKYPPFAVAFSAIGNPPLPSGQHPPSPKRMQFYQPPAQQHLARNTPPPGFAQPYGMGMRPHEEETRQIMNLDSQQTHNSSPTSSWQRMTEWVVEANAVVVTDGLGWTSDKRSTDGVVLYERTREEEKRMKPSPSTNQPYPMTNLNAYQQRGPNIYAAPVPPQMVHQNGPPGVVPTSNPYYPAPGPPPSHHHIQPQAPMMPPGMHGQQQQQQPYYNTQSPLTGPFLNHCTIYYWSSASMNYGSSQMPVPPPATNGSTPIFNFSKPRSSNEGSSANGGGHRRKKHNDLVGYHHIRISEFELLFQSSPRYNSNGSEDVDGSIFPDMSDFPLLDVVQSKAKKDAGRKPCRPHLCEQSRMLISRVCHFHREFVKRTVLEHTQKFSSRLPSRHPLANSPFSKPDQWTSQIMGISLATVRKCIDMAVDEEVFTRCTDKNLVNLTPSERAEREELLSKLSTVFEDEKTLGAGTAGMTIAEYSPRRSYSNTLVRQSTDDKSSNSSFANGADYGSSETTLLNLDDHSNHSKDFASTPTAELNNGGQIYEELGSIGGGTQESEDKSTPAVETPKRGRPRKTPGMPAKSSSKQHQSQEDSEMSEDVSPNKPCALKKEEHEKKTEDEDETTEESEKKSEETEQLVLAAERDDDAASSEGTNRSETATPEPAADTSVAKKTRAAARRKNTRTIEEELPAAAKKKRGSVTAATAGVPGLDDENSDHKMVTR
ncbi:Protein CBG03357 [Caenorhabditis briggsae]|uniref:Protein CBG03357 n=1 Tax=Caenorhabditis briggsae TaxID=6238 RepID=A8WUV0_CAEBR|nr:Protein CBG03357 [Caenorhabditis briggsae]CAP24262.2 Protein CBG03357 [Caenorhabditis briggsae]